MAYGRHATFDTLRELAFGSITGSYVKVGTVFAHDARMVHIANSTDKDLYLSVDGTNNNVRVKAGTVQDLDFTTNKVDDQGFFLPVGTQFYVKQTEQGAPGSGAIAVEVIYATPSP